MSFCKTLILLASFSENATIGIIPENIVMASIGDMMKQMMIVAKMEVNDLTSMLTFVLRLS